MAITYFQRALKLNPKYLAAWTLMGHEFMEVKNTNAAIQSYRKAVGKAFSFTHKYVPSELASIINNLQLVFFSNFSVLQSLNCFLST